MRKRYNKSSRDLFCYGCAWSNKDVGFPGRPGNPGNTYLPCTFCQRSPDVQERLLHGEALDNMEFPDGSQPVGGIPFDCYITADMMDQTEFWTDRAVDHATKSQVRKDIAAIAKEYGIDIPEHEVPN